MRKHLFDASLQIGRISAVFVSHMRDCAVNIAVYSCLFFGENGILLAAPLHLIALLLVVLDFPTFNPAP